ncbi:MAG TPA: hypothetical protein VIL22_09115 [Paenibacillaceae bacterium]
MKASRLLANVFAVLYFVFFMIATLFILLIMPFMCLSDIQVLLSTGFAVPDNPNMVMIGVIGIIIGLSMLIPALKIMYYKLPWLAPFVKIFFCNSLIMAVAFTILNYGYEVQNPARHRAFFWLMIAQIVACRLAMSFYFHKRPAKSLEETEHEQPVFVRGQKQEEKAALPSF